MKGLNSELWLDFIPWAMGSRERFSCRGVSKAAQSLLEWWYPGWVEREKPEVGKAGGCCTSSPGRRQSSPEPG